ncbi:hypothetical protein KJ909_03400 [Patescibacteria group bacterium]|nr:hypothetical protein [Patescibacteria group bacterium]
MPDSTSQYDPILKSYQSSSSSPPPPTPTPAVSPPPAPLHLLPPAQPSLPPKSEPKSSSKLAKFFFFVSLLIFIAVFSLILYTVFDKNKTVRVSSSPTPTPFSTSDNSSPVDYCLLNDQHILVGDTLPAADDCNVCICQPDLSIFCTAKSCDL